MARELDIIIFGATGFTGKHCIPIIHKLAKSQGRNLTWGVAGRSESKLKDVITQSEKQYEITLGNVATIVADIENDETLEAMAKKARIIVNCCGPYRFFGEQVVKACVKESTHHVDVSGEPQYMETMQLKYGEEAEKKGIYIVSACGFDSIPCDLGVVFMQQKFEGTLNSVVTYVEAGEDGGDGSSAGPAVNYGTWQSLVYGTAHMNELKALRRQLYPNKQPSFEPKLEHKSLPHKTDIIEGWAVPFPGSDRAVVRRSQRYFFDKESKRPVQIETYMVVKSFFNLILLGVMGMMVSILSRFEFGRSLLLNYPEKFSLGMFSKTELPSEEKIEKSWFRIRFYGEGWSEKLAEGEDSYKTPVNKSITTEVYGRNPGYGSTCYALVLSAIVTLTETEKLPSTGGVYPPGAAFAKTSLIKQLDENGVTFTVVEQKNI